LTWPLVRGAAEFFASRCEAGPDGTWHLRRVVGPDEGVAERDHTTSDDNVLTNAGVRWLMRTAVEAAGLLQAPVDPSWGAIAENLTLLPPRQDNVIPEHATYVNARIKQADTIIAFFLHLHPWPEEVVRATLAFYAPLSAGGPLMSSQIEAGILLQLGDTQKGMDWLFKRYREYVRGPFLVPFECQCNDTAVMLTGIGGLLQALIYGFHKWEPGCGRTLPRIGDGWLDDGPATARHSLAQ
jgi:trehalose/maltose hydrolase-like predicted phosphorylase